MLLLLLQYTLWYKYIYMKNYYIQRAPRYIVNDIEIYSAMLMKRNKNFKFQNKLQLGAKLT